MLLKLFFSILVTYIWKNEYTIHVYLGLLILDLTWCKSHGKPDRGVLGGPPQGGSKISSFFSETKSRPFLLAFLIYKGRRSLLVCKTFGFYWGFKVCFLSLCSTTSHKMNNVALICIRTLLLQIHEELFSSPSPDINDIKQYMLCISL